MRDDNEPKITMRLATDNAGSPKIAASEGFTHYNVVLEVENAPMDTYAATVELDPSYYDPIRTLSPDPDGKFRLETTAYGDYPVIVRLHRKSGDMILREGMVRALKRSRGAMPANPKIDEALSYIADH